MESSPVTDPAWTRTATTRARTVRPTPAVGARSRAEKPARDAGNGRPLTAHVTDIGESDLFVADVPVFSVTLVATPTTAVNGRAGRTAVGRTGIPAGAAGLAAARVSRQYGASRSGNRVSRTDPFPLPGSEERHRPSLHTGKRPGPRSPPATTPTLDESETQGIDAGADIRTRRKVAPKPTPGQLKIRPPKHDELGAEANRKNQPCPLTPHGTITWSIIREHHCATKAYGPRTSYDGQANKDAERRRSAPTLATAAKAKRQARSGETRARRAVTRSARAAHHPPAPPSDLSSASASDLPAPGTGRRRAARTRNVTQGSITSETPSGSGRPAVVPVGVRNQSRSGAEDGSEFGVDGRPRRAAARLAGERTRKMVGSEVEQLVERTSKESKGKTMDSLQFPNESAVPPALGDRSRRGKRGKRKGDDGDYDACSESGSLAPSDSASNVGGSRQNSDAGGRIQGDQEFDHWDAEIDVQVVGWENGGAWEDGRPLENDDEQKRRRKPSAAAGPMVLPPADPLVVSGPAPTPSALASPTTPSLPFRAPAPVSFPFPVDDDVSLIGPTFNRGGAEHSPFLRELLENVQSVGALTGSDMDDAEGQSLGSRSRWATGGSGTSESDGAGGGDYGTGSESESESSRKTDEGVGWKLGGTVGGKWSLQTPEPLGDWRAPGLRDRRVRPHAPANTLLAAAGSFTLPLNPGIGLFVPETPMTGQSKFPDLSRSDNETSSGSTATYSVVSVGSSAAKPKKVTKLRMASGATVRKVVPSAQRKVITAPSATYTGRKKKADLDIVASLWAGGDNPGQLLLPGRTWAVSEDELTERAAGDIEAMDIEHISPVATQASSALIRGKVDPPVPRKLVLGPAKGTAPVIPRSLRSGEKTTGIGSGITGTVAPKRIRNKTPPLNYGIARSSTGGSSPDLALKAKMKDRREEPKPRTRYTPPIARLATNSGATASPSDNIKTKITPRKAPTTASSAEKIAVPLRGSVGLGLRSSPSSTRQTAPKAPKKTALEEARAAASIARVKARQDAMARQDSLLANKKTGARSRTAESEGLVSAGEGIPTSPRSPYSKVFAKSVGDWPITHADAIVHDRVVVRSRTHSEAVSPNAHNAYQSAYESLDEAGTARKLAGKRVMDKGKMRADIHSNGIDGDTTARALVDLEYVNGTKPAVAKTKRGLGDPNFAKPLENQPFKSLGESRYGSGKGSKFLPSSSTGQRVESRVHPKSSTPRPSANVRPSSATRESTGDLAEPVTPGRTVYGVRRRVVEDTPSPVPQRSGKDSYIDSRIMELEHSKVPSSHVDSTSVTPPSEYSTSLVQPSLSVAETTPTNKSASMNANGGSGESSTWAPSGIVCTVDVNVDSVPDLDGVDVDPSGKLIAAPAEAGNEEFNSPTTDVAQTMLVPDTDTDITKVQRLTDPAVSQGSVSQLASLAQFSASGSMSPDQAAHLRTPEDRKAMRRVRASMKRHRMSIITPNDSPWIEVGDTRPLKLPSLCHSVIYSQLPTPKPHLQHFGHKSRAAGLSSSFSAGDFTGLLSAARRVPFVGDLASVGVCTQSKFFVEINHSIHQVTLDDLLPYFTMRRVVTFEDGLTFSAPSRSTSLLSTLKKIAEATYSEVYEMTIPDSVDKKRPGTRCVVKVVPVGGDISVNDSPQLTLKEVAAEVVCTSAVSELGPGFVKLARSFIAQGRYPKALLNEWDKFAKKRGTENERPDFLPSEQLYMVLVLEHAGTELEKFKIRSWKESESVFVQLVLALAAAEEKIRFEHRDLHWGNVMILPSSSEIANVTWRRYPATLLPGGLHSPGSSRAGVASVSVPSAGLEVRIIDYTLSRCNAGGRVWFNNMADEDIFKSEGDRQFDVYREMRDHTAKDWGGFYPKTNLMWLSYILDKLLNSKEKKPPTLRGKAKSEEEAAKKRLQDVALRLEGYADTRELLKTELEGWTRLGLTVGRTSGRTSSM
ncbi:Serine/threonine-protein kinase haspin [Gonapodya sp. JEL0774]|nr:Serine/threonine-protein kinase haspin [Gonapodya sp. JEL0774]